MSTVSNLFQCPVCCHYYSFDKSLVNQHAKDAPVPVSCCHCSYTICFECVKKQQVSRSETKKRIYTTIPCPVCKKSSAFKTSAPVVNTYACDLLQYIRNLPQPKEEDANEVAAGLLESTQASIMAEINNRTIKDEMTIGKAHESEPAVEPSELDHEESQEEDNSSSTDNGEIEEEDTEEDREPALKSSSGSSRSKRSTGNASVSSHVNIGLAISSARTKRAGGATQLNERAGKKQRPRSKSTTDSAQRKCYVEVGNISLPTHAKHSGWEGFEEYITDSNRPKSFMFVLMLMDFFFEVAEGEDGFYATLWIKATSGNKTGYKTRVQLRGIKKKQPDGQLKWHMKQQEWAPKTKADLKTFI